MGPRPPEQRQAVLEEAPIMRITTVRIISQTFFFAAFALLLGRCTLTSIDHLPYLRNHLSTFLDLDPLVAISTAITTGTVYSGLAYSLIVLGATLLLGRVFCGWVCPFGAIHHFSGWLFDHRKTKERIEANAYRPLYRWKYYILIALGVALAGSLALWSLAIAAVLTTVAVLLARWIANASGQRDSSRAVSVALLIALMGAVFIVARGGEDFGKDGTLQIGLLDPICLVHRSMTIGVIPALNVPAPMVRSFGDPRVHHLGWVIGLLFVGLVLMNPRFFRFFCRVLCPLGALLGLVSRFGLWRIERDRWKCVHCGLCRSHCEGACDPDTHIRAAECMVCFNCLEDCPHQAIRFSFMPAADLEIRNPDLSRRGAMAAIVTGAITPAWMRVDPRSGRDFSASAIRPPGAVEEIEFLKRCVKCGQCIRVCPTNVLQPDWFDSGIEGLWTPVMNYRIGYCEPNCTACGQVCPTGAIQRMSIDQKRGQGSFADAGPVRTGSAHFDVGRCLPWAKNMPCLVCEENCPVSPKAIHTERRQMVLRDGKKVVASATDNSVTLKEWPTGPTDPPKPCLLGPGALTPKTDQTFHLSIRRADGLFETHPIKTNTADTVMIDGKFGLKPVEGSMAVLVTELGLPRVDLSQCIGCGICEYKCVVAGDKRAVYVMAVGETRSRQQPEEQRNRSLRL